MNQKQSPTKSQTIDVSGNLIGYSFKMHSHIFFSFIYFCDLLQCTLIFARNKHKCQYNSESQTPILSRLGATIIVLAMLELCLDQESLKIER